MNTALIILAVAALVFFLTRSKRKPKSSQPGVHGWRITQSKGMPAAPTMQGNGWVIDIPTNPEHNVNYVQWLDPPPLIGKASLTLRFKVTGGGFVFWQYPENPATVSLMLQRKGDNMGAQGVYESYRFFSHQAIPLAAGEFELVVPLDVSAWGGVMGGKDPAMFQAMLENLDNISVIFGGDGGRGHGVYATQPSTFEMLGLEVR